MKRPVLYLLLSTLALVVAPGLRPRTDANSYTTHVVQGDLSIGAALIPPERVKKMFKLDLSHAGYVVVEVGVFPAPGKDVDLWARLRRAGISGSPSSRGSVMLAPLVPAPQLILVDDRQSPASGGERGFSAGLVSRIARADPR